MSVISRSASFPGNIHVSDSSPAASGAWPYRFVSKRKAIYPRVIHAVPGDHPERCPKFRDISTSNRAPKRVRLGCRSTAYAVHRLRAPFVRVIIVALFDSNLVLGSFVLIYWAASACSVIAGTYVLCAEPRVYSFFVYVVHVSKPRPMFPCIGGNVKRSHPRSSQLSRYYLFKGRRVKDAVSMAMIKIN